MKTELLPGGIKLLQSNKYLKLGADAVLLAAFCPKAERICELGCGVGNVLLALAGRQPDATLVGVEINPDAAALCRESVALNALDGRVEVVTADLRGFPPELCGSCDGTPTRLAAGGEAADGAAAQECGVLTAEYAEQDCDVSDIECAAPSGRSGASPASAPPSFDLVVMNPPYLRAGTVRESANLARNLERVDRTAAPDDVASAAARLLCVGGSLCLVLRYDRLGDYLAALGTCGFAARELRPVAHTPSHAPSLVLLRAEKVSAAVETVVQPAPTLCLADGDGAPSEEYLRILGGGRL